MIGFNETLRGKYMDSFMGKIQSAYGFSDYEIRLIRYSMTALFYDCSKLVIFGIFYYLTGDFKAFLFALFPLILLRTKNGGIHFKRYWSCFLFTFAYLELCIHILPVFLPLPPVVLCAALPVCALIDWLVGPNSLVRKKGMDEVHTRNAKIQTLLLILLLEILCFVFPADAYLTVSFWTVVLHVVQLCVTKGLKEVQLYEKKS